LSLGYRRDARDVSYNQNNLILHTRLIKYMKTERILHPPISKVLKSGRVTLEPGEEIGEHVTDRREELLVVLSGSAVIEKEGKMFALNKGETHYIPEGIRHNVKNLSSETLEYIYIVSLFD